MTPQELFEMNSVFFAREYMAAFKKGFIKTGKPKIKQPQIDTQDWADHFSQIAQVVLNSVPKKEPK